jgi:lipoprotein LpqH
MAAARTVAAQGKVTIDDQGENLQGSCFTPSDGSGINMSLSGATTKINVALDGTRPPNVSSVVLVTGDVALGYQSGKQGVAHATQNGNTYNITGTATGLNEAAGQIANSAFQITVACL